MSASSGRLYGPTGGPTSRSNTTPPFSRISEPTTSSPGGRPTSTSSQRRSPPGCSSRPPACMVTSASRDVAAPGAGLDRPALDELLEVLEVLLDGAVVDAERVADLLRDVLRLPVELHGHPRLARPELVEGDDAGLALAVHAGPGNALVRVLLGDHGVELPLHPGDADRPVVVRVVL